MALAIVYVTHSTSVDNENGVASGYGDPDLSKTGERQAVELGTRYKGESIEAVYCSDLTRAYRTAKIAFSAAGIPIIRDARCREVDYGTMTGRPVAEIDAARVEHVDTPFPGGESYTNAAKRLKLLLDDAHTRFPGGVIVLIGHRATYVALQHLCRGVSMVDAVLDPRPWREEWRYKYCPGSIRLESRELAPGTG